MSSHEKRQHHLFEEVPQNVQVTKPSAVVIMKNKKYSYVVIERVEVLKVKKQKKEMQARCQL